MTTDNDNNLLSFLQSFNKLALSASSIASEYWIVYFHSFERMFNNMSIYTQANIIDPYSAFRYWLKTTDLECEKHLRSQEFLNSFYNYVDNEIQLLCSLRTINGNYLRFLLGLTEYTDKFLNTTRAGMLVASSYTTETPYEIVYRNEEEVRLLRYCSHHKHQKTPLLLVYAPINRYYIMDIAKDRSIVEKFVSAGFDVFLLDWGRRQGNSESTISDYIFQIDRSVEEIKRLTKSEKISLLGYSWGGTLSVMYASLHSEKIMNLIIQSSQIDFDNDNSILAQWIRSFPIDRYSNEFDTVSSHLINMGFLMRNPVSHSFDYVKYAFGMINSSDRTDSNIVDAAAIPKFLGYASKIAMWLNDTTNIPTKFFTQFVKDLYQGNFLIKNQMQIQKEKDSSKSVGAKTVELAKISMPLLNIVGEQDDLVPASSSIPLNEVVSSSDKMLLRFPPGHVELCVSSDSHERLWPQVTKWLEQRS